MHILYLCNEYPPYPHGGAGSFVQTISRQLTKLGHKVSVVGVYRIPRSIHETDKGVDVFRISAMVKTIVNPIINNIYIGQKINEINMRSPIDLIEGNELSFGLLPVAKSIPKIIRIEGGHVFFSKTLGKDTKPLTKILERLSFARADHLCAVSRFAAITTSKLLKLSHRRICVLPNPVDTTVFRPLPDIQEIDGLIIFTGGLREKKGIRQLLRAMPQILTVHPNAELWIQGGDFIDKDSGVSMLEILIAELPSTISAHVKFKGYVEHSQLPFLNAKATVLVYPSWMETQGIVVIEGMAAGKAVVASQTGPGPELIDDGVDGLLCDPHSPKSIAEKVILLLNDPGLRRNLGMHARLKVLENFSIDVLIEKNLEFYKSCLK